jgi:hypothetical protein
MAKKKPTSKKRRKAPEGVDPNEKRRERLEARRQAKAEAIARQRRTEQRARLIRMAVYAGLFGLAVWFFFFRGPNLPEQVQGHEVQSFSGTGENDHTDAPVAYDESPPVSGQHAASPLVCGTYAEPVANEGLVHSLEHGAVYALYSRDLPVEQIRTLEGLAAEEDWSENFLVAPYDDLPEGTVVSVGSWGHRMDLSEFDRDAIVEFKDTFESQGTAEASIGCENASEEQFEAEEDAAPEPGAGATPGSTPTPTPTNK